VLNFKTPFTHVRVFLNPIASRRVKTQRNATDRTSCHQTPYNSDNKKANIKAKLLPEI
jgi:hypothetical protein